MAVTFDDLMKEVELYEQNLRKVSTKLSLRPRHLVDNGQSISDTMTPVQSRPTASKVSNDSRCLAAFANFHQATRHIADLVAQLDVIAESVTKDALGGKLVSTVQQGKLLRTPVH